MFHLVQRQIWEDRDAYLRIGVRFPNATQDTATRAATTVGLVSFSPTREENREKPAMSGAGNQVIYLGTLSKTFAPGLRVGWMTGPKFVIDRIAGVREQMDFGISGITQAIAERVLTTGIWEQNVKRLRSELTRRRDIIVDALNLHFGDELQFTVPQGSYHIWGKLKQSVRDKDLVEASIRHGVVVMPGSLYGAGPGYVRLTYASSQANQIQDGIQRLYSALHNPESPLIYLR